MLSDVRFRIGPPIPGAPWSRPRRPAPLGTGDTPTPAVPLNPATFLFDENANTPERLRVVCQQMAQLLNQFIRQGKLTTDFIGGSPTLTLTSDEVTDALGFTPADADTAIPTTQGVTGGGTLGNPEPIRTDDTVLRQTTSGSAQMVVFIRNSIGTPSANPSGGVFLYSDNGVLMVRQPDGTLITL